MQAAIAPFFLQALRGDARSGKTYFVRAVMIGFLLLTLVGVQQSWRYLSAAGLQLFSSIVGTTAFIVCLAGPLYFATVITDEKESQTLGLLKMTALQPAWILMGKSTSVMIGAVMLLIAQLPLVVLAVTLGGVALRQIVAAYCALAAHLVLMANVGLLFSTLGRTRGRAVAGTTCALLAFFVLPGLGRQVLQGLVSAGLLTSGGLIDSTFGALFQWARDASIFTRCGVVLSTGFSGSPIGFQVLTNLAGGLVFFLLAWAGFERATRDHRAGTPGRGLLLRRTSRLRWLSAGRVWTNALAWKDFYFIAGGKGFAIVKFVVLGAVLIGIYVLSEASGGGMDAEDFGGLIMVLMTISMGLQLVLFHGRILGRERQWNTLSNLLMLPHSPAGVVWRKLLGCLLGLLPDLAWFGIGALFNLEGLFDVLEAILTEPEPWYFISQYVLLLQLALYLPLLVRRGALLLAFVIWLVSSYMLVPIFMILTIAGGFSNPGLWFGMTSVPIFGLALLIHVRTMKRLRVLAGRE